jgi:hypothetical protein
MDNKALIRARKLLASAGGFARAKKLTKKRLREIALLGVAARLARKKQL